MAREPQRTLHVFRPFNQTYGPWYRLEELDGKKISGGEVLVMPDMDRGRWFWYVRIGGKKDPTTKRSGHEPSLEEAKATARKLFDELY